MIRAARVTWAARVAGVAGHPGARMMPGRRASAADLTFLSALGAWLLWAVLAATSGGRPLAGASEYLTLPLLLAGGLALGRIWARGRGGPLLPGAAMAVALLVLLVPLYANAAAAIGVQLVAVAGLTLWATLQRRGADDRRVAGDREAAPARRGAPPEKRSPVGQIEIATVLSAMTGVLGVVLAARSQAATLLVVVVAAAVALALVRPDGCSRRLSAGIGLTAMLGAQVAVAALAGRSVWPGWLERDESLSWTRQQLWRDALELWRAHPVRGGGPGSFLESSAIARSEPYLSSPHSALLQVAAELGGIGVLLLLAVLVTGAAAAVQGSRGPALIGVAAWSALGVHSAIDHLYEFPILVLLAGAVIGGAGSRVTPFPRDPLPARPQSARTPVRVTPREPLWRAGRTSRRTGSHVNTILS